MTRRVIDRHALRERFRAPGPIVTPVIHVLDTAQTTRNVRIAQDGGADGVFLINHDFPMKRLIPIIQDIREAFPTLWCGVNFLGVTALRGVPVLSALTRRGWPVQAYWADDARIDERATRQEEAERMDGSRERWGFEGLYLGGVAFKKQRPVAPEDHARAAAVAANHMDVVCTSGVATGEAADLAKIRTFRAALGDHPLALASGVTPENAETYAQDVDWFLVATGVSPPGDFHNLDPARLAALLEACGRRGGAR